MEKDSEINHEKIVENLSVESNEIENVENNQNVLNYGIKLIQLEELKVTEQKVEVIQETLVTETSLKHLDNIMISEEDESRQTQSDTKLEVENEDELNFHRQKNKKSKFNAILDSDSENEENSFHVLPKNDEISNPLEIHEFEKDSENGKSEIQNKKPRRIAIIDSDSDDDTSNTSGKSLKKNLEEIENTHSFQTDQRKILSALCDSESSDDNSNENEQLDENSAQISDSEMEALQGNVVLTNKSRQSKSKKINGEKQEKMTAKKALEQRKEIFSESQRKIRESRVSLPYHKPKQRSLKEFLENRPKLSSALTNVHNAASPSTAIKMSTEQLEIVSKKLKEREKEVQQFYKSESESEGEDLPINSANSDTNVLTQESNISTNIDTFQAETEEKITNIEINNMLESNSNNDNICADNSEADILLQETDSSNINPSQYGIMENNGSSDIDQEHQNNCNYNCANIETRENIEQSEMKSFAESIQNSNENIGISCVALNLNETNDVVSNFQNSEEMDQLNNANHNKNPDESKQELIDTSNQKSTSLHLMQHGEENNIHSDVQKNSVEKKFTDEAENEFMNINSVDTAQIKKIPDFHESFKPIDLDESGKVDKLIILSDVVVKRSHLNKSENIYNLDNESLNVGSDVKDSTYESENYDFNLDDLNDEFECDNNEQTEKSEVEAKNEKKCQLPKGRQELLEKLGSLKPRLSCGPSELIDLENGLTLPDEVSKLRERFLQHHIKIGKHKHKKEISILSVNDGKIQTETLALNVDEDDEENTAPLEKPGVRLQKLREELEHQMAKRRSDMWKEKLDQTNRNKEENNEKSDAEDEKSASGVDNILDNDEEEEFTESELEDEELEEDDYDMSDQVKKKSAFVDEEAEESDVEEEVEEIELKETSEEVDMDQEDADTKYDEEMEELENEVPKKKVLKRIITSLDNDDSDNEDIVPHNKIRFPFLCANKEKKVSSDEECLTPHQPTNYKIKEPVVTPTESENDFLTPITYMTGIQNLNTSGSRIVAPINSSPEKQLAGESGLESQGFYGNFPNTPQVLISNTAGTEEASPTNFSSQAEHNVLSTQDVLDVCSGNFPTSTQATSDPEMSTQQLKEIFTGVEGISQKSDFNTQQLADICSGQFTGVPQFEKSSREEIALDESEENIISQLIDEEELERFKKKFESPVASYTQKTIDFENVKEVEGTGGVIDSEDDDDELHLKKKKNKRLNFSDEESDEYSEEEEIIDLHDKDPSSDVEYDSEENEIDLESKDVDNETNKQEKIKITDFLENEAELSESEWGSEDEDEKNLDDMEFEKGDEEKFDEELLRSDIERVQMRQMLDEDNREVKLLQELLLEDGELHGSGRQRQFRWKNIDATGNDMEETKFDDGDTYHDEEEESEEKWRKMRHQREMFMLKKQSQEEDVLIESQKLSFTNKALKIKNQTAILSHTMSEEVTSSSKIKQPFSLLNKRGSFLSRSKQILQKYAETTKLSTGTKSSSRIVFQTVDGEMKKRKAASQDNDCTPVALKKLRLSDLSPALQKIRPKLGKTLFEDLSID